MPLAVTMSGVSFQGHPDEADLRAVHVLDAYGGRIVSFVPAYFTFAAR